MEINVYTFMVDSIVNFFYIYNVFFDTLSLHFSVFPFRSISCYNYRQFET